MLYISCTCSVSQRSAAKTKQSVSVRNLVLLQLQSQSPQTRMGRTHVDPLRLSERKYSSQCYKTNVREVRCKHEYKHGAHLNQLFKKKKKNLNPRRFFLKVSQANTSLWSKKSVLFLLGPMKEKDLKPGTVFPVLGTLLFFLPERYREKLCCVTPLAQKVPSDLLHVLVSVSPPPPPPVPLFLHLSLSCPA